MRLDGINAQGGNQAVHLLQVIVLQRQPPDLGGAHGREVGGVTEEDGPLSLLPLVERIEVAVRRFHGEVGDDVAEANATVGGPFGVQAHVGFGSGFHGVHRGHGSTGR